MRTCPPAMLTYGRTASSYLFSIYSKSQSNSVEPHCPYICPEEDLDPYISELGTLQTSTWHDITYPSHSVFSFLVQPMLQFLESVEKQTFQKQRGIWLLTWSWLLTLMYHSSAVFCHDLVIFCLLPGRCIIYQLSVSTLE